MVWDRNNSQQEMDRAMIGLDVVFLFFLSFFLSFFLCLYVCFLFIVPVAQSVPV